MIFKNFKRFFGNKAFYKMVFVVTIPIIIQQVLINVVNLADNVMVGQLSQSDINGVYISSQVLFVCNLCMFGSVAGSGIFFAQYFGSNDEKHLKFVFKFKIIAALIIASILFIVLTFFIEPIAHLFTDVETEIQVCKNYIGILKYSVFPFALSNVLATSFREVKKTLIPMFGSALALGINVILNYILIFGHFGLPRLEIEGAAIATLIARFIELFFLIVMTYVLKMNYIKGLFKKGEKLEKGLIPKLIKCSIPLFMNEFLWSFGQMVISIGLCSRGEDARSGLAIANTVNNLFYIGALSLGNAISIIIGNTLGAGEIEKAKIQARQLIMLAVFVAIGFGTALIGFSSLITKAYNVSDDVRQIAINTMIIFGSMMWMFAINCSCFFVIRAGGNTKIVLAFDSLFTWFIQVPLSLIFAFFTNVSFETIFFIVQGSEIIKLTLGLIMVHRNTWARNLVGVN